MTHEPSDRLAGAQTMRTEARLTANTLVLTWIREVVTFVSERLPIWEQDTRDVNRAYTDVLNNADRRMIDLVTVIVGMEQVVRDEHDATLEHEIADIRERLLALAARLQDTP